MGISDICISVGMLHEYIILFAIPQNVKKVSEISHLLPLEYRNFIFVFWKYETKLICKIISLVFIPSMS